MGTVFHINQVKVFCLSPTRRGLPRVSLHPRDPTGVWVHSSSSSFIFSSVLCPQYLTLFDGLSKQSAKPSDLVMPTRLVVLNPPAELSAAEQIDGLPNDQFTDPHLEGSGVNHKEHGVALDTPQYEPSDSDIARTIMKVIRAPDLPQAERALQLKQLDTQRCVDIMFKVTILFSLPRLFGRIFL